MRKVHELYSTCSRTASGGRHASPTCSATMPGFCADLTHTFYLLLLDHAGHAVGIIQLRRDPRTAQITRRQLSGASSSCSIFTRARTDPLDVPYGLLHALLVDTKRNSRISVSKLGEPTPEGWLGGAFGAVLEKSRNIFGSKTKLEKVNRTVSGYTSQLPNTT